MGVLTDQEKEEDYKAILEFMTAVKINAEMIRQKDGYDGDGIYVWEPGNGEDDSDRTGAFIYLMQLDEGEKAQVCKAAVFYMQFPRNMEECSMAALCQVCAVLNRHVGLGCFIPSQEEDRVVLQYRYVHMMEQGEAANAGVIAEILLDMFGYMDYARDILTLAGEENEQ